MMLSSLGSAHKHQLIHELLIHDVMVAASLLVLIFGSLVPMQLFSKSAEFSSTNFTDISLARAGQQLNSFTYPDSHITLDLAPVLAAVNLGIESLIEVFTQPINVYVIADINNSPGEVMGVQDSPGLAHQISPWLNQPLPLPPTPPALSSTTPVPTIDADIIPTGEWTSLDGSQIVSANPVVLGYEVDSSLVDRVEFYVDNHLATVDSNYPYFLGGDQGGSPVGYQFKPGNYIVSVRVYFLTAPQNYSEHARQLVVGEY